MLNVYSIVLAAGQGVRMKSKIPKVLHEIGGKPMIDHVLDNLSALNIQDIIVVVGHKYQEVVNYLDEDIQYVEQKEQLGTAHAVLQAKSKLLQKKGITLIMCGDTPLITVETLKSLIEQHVETKAAATILTAKVSTPTGYGRIIRDNNEFVLKIVEEKDASSENKMINEINSGVYCFDNIKLFKEIEKIDNNNNKSEYYLTDIIGIFKSNGEKVAAYQTTDCEEIIGINDREMLAKADDIFRKRILNNHMKDGVTIVDPNNTYIEKDVKIGQDTIIYPNTFLKGKTIIDGNCKIGPGVDITDVIIGEGTTITYSVISSSIIGKNTNIGPFAYIRPGAKIGEFVKIGDFVEIKNSSIGNRTKISHLSYIGDSNLGENINVGCGTITVNYDGSTKSRINIADNSFIGCNSNLIAPVSIGEGSYIAAGSTITNDVPDGALAIARERQSNKEGYAKKLKGKQQSKSIHR